jgi:hypothetical protein
MVRSSTSLGASDADVSGIGDEHGIEVLRVERHGRMGVLHGRADRCPEGIFYEGASLTLAHRLEGAGIQAMMVDVDLGEDPHFMLRPPWGANPIDFSAHLPHTDDYDLLPLVGLEVRDAVTRAAHLHDGMEVYRDLRDDIAPLLDESTYHALAAPDLLERTACELNVLVWGMRKRLAALEATDQLRMVGLVQGAFDPIAARLLWIRGRMGLLTRQQVHYQDGAHPDSVEKNGPDGLRVAFLSGRTRRWAIGNGTFDLDWE